MIPAASAKYKTKPPKYPRGCNSTQTGSNDAIKQYTRMMRSRLEREESATWKILNIQDKQLQGSRNKNNGRQPQWRIPFALKNPMIIANNKYAELAQLLLRQS